MPIAAHPLRSHPSEHGNDATQTSDSPIGGKLIYQSTKKRVSKPKYLVTGKRIQGDVDQLLEKRIQSCFSYRKLLFLPPSMEGLQRFCAVSHMDLQTGFLFHENFKSAFSSIQRQPKLECLRRMTILDSLLCDCQHTFKDLIICFSFSIRDFIHIKVLFSITCFHTRSWFFFLDFSP